VDIQLKKNCEELILNVAKAVIEPVSSFLLKASAFKIRQDRFSQLKNQPFATPGLMLFTCD
jgi:hypothetical protein